MECKKRADLQTCACTYEPCPRKGVCCECVTYHRANREIPGCLFDPEAERTYDRSFENFSASLKRNKNA